MVVNSGPECSPEWLVLRLATVDDRLKRGDLFRLVKMDY
jgi:hypothetical protein